MRHLHTTGYPLKLVDKFTHLGGSISLTENDIKTRLTKAWTAVYWLSVIEKSDLTDQITRSFLRSCRYCCMDAPHGRLQKVWRKKARRQLQKMLRAMLNKSWTQQPKQLYLYCYQPHITKTLQVKLTKHAGHCWKNKNELIIDVLRWTPSHGQAKVGWPARTFIESPALI